MAVALIPFDTAWGRGPDLLISTRPLRRRKFIRTNLAVPLVPRFVLEVGVSPMANSR